MQVTNLIAKGKLNKEIGLDLHLGEGTIKVIVSIILAKTGMANRTCLAVWWLLQTNETLMAAAAAGMGPAYKNGLVRCPDPGEAATPGVVKGEGTKDSQILCFSFRTPASIRAEPIIASVAGSGTCCWANVLLMLTAAPPPGR